MAKKTLSCSGKRKKVWDFIFFQSGKSQPFLVTKGRKAFFHVSWEFRDNESEMVLGKKKNSQLDLTAKRTITMNFPQSSNIWKFGHLAWFSGSHSEALNLQYSLWANTTCVLQENNPNTLKDNHMTLLKTQALGQNKSIVPIQMSIIIPRKLEHNIEQVQFNLRETKAGMYARLETWSVLKFTIKSKMLTIDKIVILFLLL